MMRRGALGLMALGLACRSPLEIDTPDGPTAVGAELSLHVLVSEECTSNRPCLRTPVAVTGLEIEGEAFSIVGGSTVKAVRAGQSTVTVRGGIGDEEHEAEVRLEAAEIDAVDLTFAGSVFRSMVVPEGGEIVMGWRVRDARGRTLFGDGFVPVTPSSPGLELESNPEGILVRAGPGPSRVVLSDPIGRDVAEVRVGRSDGATGLVVLLEPGIGDSLSVVALGLSPEGAWLPFYDEAEAVFRSATPEICGPPRGPPDARAPLAQPLIFEIRFPGRCEVRADAGSLTGRASARVTLAIPRVGRTL
ncbi:MAG: hypothetical protein AAFZ18_15455 [Myxococcota bacterium]